jgi:hypothetical protein
VGASWASTLRRFLYHFFRRETVLRALKVAVVVGPLLSIINHYDLFLNLDFSLRLIVKMFMTCLVPYSVSSFSSARAYMDREAPLNQKLQVTSTNTEERLSS